MQILALREKVLGYWRSNEELSRQVLTATGRSIIILFAAYILGSVASSVSLTLISNTAMKHRFKSKQEVERPRVGKETNYRDVRKVILGRNVFNSAGALPDEPDPSPDGSAGTAFNPNDKCQKPTVNVELLGIILTGDPESSLATILEKGYTIADIYRAGDRIIGQEQAQIHAVEEGRVVLNNNGVKECLEINSLLSANKSDPGISLPAASPAPSVGSDSGSEGGGADCPSGTVALETSYVEDSLGPGFSKILETGRLVPYHRDNAMVGFKLIGVRGGSLWSRANLNSGDVITAVNGTSMAQPEKGFAVYEALQSDKAIRVEFLKGGKSPCNLSIEIK
jgi:type II secretion system protein C